MQTAQYCSQLVVAPIQIRGFPSLRGLSARSNRFVARRVLADWPRDGFRAPLGTGFGRYLIERKIDIGVHGASRAHGNSCDQLLMRTETSNMKPNEPSRTALIIARQRAAHQVLDHGSILYDPFAMKILREDEKDVLQFANAHPLASIGRLLTTARSRIAEDALSGAVERGVRQIVILGAGLDTFALRNPHSARQIRIYEVDHPATQAWKRQRLAEAQIELPPSLILVPVDFERDDVGEKLVAAGFQQNSPAFFTWLGVVLYLTRHAVARTLDYMSSIQNSEVVFDYMEPPEAFSEELRQFEKERTEQIKKIDERSATRFEPAGIAAMLRSHGLSDLED